jgi:hypothetical protein
MEKHEKHYIKFRKYLSLSKHHSERAKYRKTKADNSVALGFLHRVFHGLHKEREERHLELSLKNALKHSEEVHRKYNSLIAKLDEREKRRNEQRKKIDAALEAWKKPKNRVVGKSEKNKGKKTSKKRKEKNVIKKQNKSRKLSGKIKKQYRRKK